MKCYTLYNSLAIDTNISFHLLSTSSITTCITGFTNWPGSAGSIIALPAVLSPCSVNITSSSVSSATPSMRTKMVSSNGSLAFGPSMSNDVGVMKKSAFGSSAANQRKPKSITNHLLLCFTPIGVCMLATSSLSYYCS